MHNASPVEDLQHSRDNIILEQYTQLVQTTCTGTTRKELMHQHLQPVTLMTNPGSAHTSQQANATVERAKSGHAIRAWKYLKKNNQRTRKRACPKNNQRTRKRASPT